MNTDITFCHGEGNLGRVCARRQCCQRHAGLLIELSAQNPARVAQAAMLCRPSVMMLGEASYATENAYRFFIPVRGAVMDLSASGGSGSAARRMGSVTQAGAGLFGVLTGAPVGPGETSVDLNSLTGLPCELAISTITQALTTEDGDSEKIHAAMNRALVEALNGVKTFDPKCLTDDVIVNIMIGYLAESIFLQMVFDSNKAWNKAETPAQAMRAENALRELIKVVVDRHMAPKLASNIRTFTRQQMAQIERQAIIDARKEWEAYQ